MTAPCPTCGALVETTNEPVDSDGDGNQEIEYVCPDCKEAGRGQYVGRPFLTDRPGLFFVAVE